MKTKTITTLMIIAACSITAVAINEKMHERTEFADPVAAVLGQRHSGYAFDPSKPVTQEQIKTIIKAGQSAPSSYNDQPWCFVVCDRTTDPEAYEKVLSTLVEFNQGWAKNAPVLVLVIASENSHQAEYNRWAQYDTGAAAFSMMLQATSLGLMAHQMGGFDAQKVSAIFEISRGYVPMAVMAIGYEMPEEKKSVKKERKPLEENFFVGSWGTK